jgi:hypothetical protein
MAIPITPQDTQKNCAPVSSNCVIWQGPDIPMINLCKGDSISDVTAKLASELTTLVEQLDITGFDVSCFPPICPKPENIHDLIQFILDTLCACCVNGQGGSGGGGGGTTTCEESLSCEVPIAACFQYVDSFGNNVTTMKLVDYAQAIANKVCGFTSQISTINTTLTDHETRLDTLEACVLPCNTEPVQPTVPSSECILPTQTDIPIVDFVEELELQFCNLKSAAGTPAQMNTALALSCPSLDASPSLADPITHPAMSTLSGWTPSANTDTLAESFGNLWLTVCDLRDAFMNLKTTVEACCGVSCADNIVSLSGLMTGRFSADLTMSGNINNAFQYCPGVITGTIKITDPWNNITTITTTEDIISDINNNTAYSFDFNSAPGNAVVSLVVYNVKVEACLRTADNSVTCNINESTLFQNTLFIESYNKFSSDSVGACTIQIANPRANTTYNIYLKDASTGAILATHNTGLVTTVSVVSKIFTGLTPGTQVQASVTATQNLYTINCPDTSIITID